MKTTSLLACVAVSLLAFAPAPLFSQRVQLAPRLHTGQTFFYRIDYSVTRNTRTESRVVSPETPPIAHLDVSGMLQVQVVDASASGLRLKTYFSERAAAREALPSVPARAGTADLLVEVSISQKGVASQLKGYDQLSGEQKAAWSDWLSRFTSSMTFPSGGLRSGQKWENNEPETTPAPIAGLWWAKKYEYAHDEPCARVATASNNGPSQLLLAGESCAVILVRSTLRQKSSPKNSTPQDYKLNSLKTRGIANGHNETILYVSRASGLLVRSTEDAQQSMEVSIALSDESNQLHYSLTAKSRSEIALLPESPQ